MSRKLVTFKVTVEVDDSGEFDSYTMRSGLIEAYHIGLAEGMYTNIDDTTTVIDSVTISHEGTLNA